MCFVFLKTSFTAVNFFGKKRPLKISTRKYMGHLCFLKYASSTKFFCEKKLLNVRKSSTSTEIYTCTKGYLVELFKNIFGNTFR